VDIGKKYTIHLKDYYPESLTSLVSNACNSCSGWLMPWFSRTLKKADCFLMNVAVTLQGKGWKPFLKMLVRNPGQFIQNKCLRYWMDHHGTSKYDLNKYCAVLASEFPFADELNSMARQASAERAWSAISRFYENCKKRKTGSKLPSAMANTSGH